MLQNAGVLYILPCKCASRHSGVPFLDMWTSKSGPRVWCFPHFDLQICFAPQRRAIFEHRNFQNVSDAEVFSTFWLFKYASRHSGVQFLNIGTSKMSPTLRCFLHFDLQICFAPERRAIFEHRNFQNGSANVVFWAFWLANVLRATAACHFSPVCQNSYLRTRRFSEATFLTSATTNHWKNTAIRDVSNLWRAYWTPCYWFYTHVDLLATESTRMLIFLLLTLHTCWSSCYWLCTHVDLLATDMTAVLPCFSILHIVGS